MTHHRPLARLALACLLFVTLGACDCVGRRLVIVDPERQASLGAADDLDVVRAGLQREVHIDATHLPIATEVEVHVTEDGTLTEDDFIYTGLVAPDRSVTVLATLPEGPSVLVACAGEACAVRSPPVPIEVSSSTGICPLVQFTSPRARGTGELLLEASDDQALEDGACGAVFATKVRARVEVDDGTRVTLSLDGRPTKTVPVMAHFADFGPIVLGNRGADTARMHLTVEGFGGTCPEVHPNALRVGCEGSTCRIAAPDEPSGYLNASRDARPTTGGLDLDVRAESAVGGVGREFRLVDPDANQSLATATAASGGGVSRATFQAVRFAEGPVAFAAVCSDGTTTTVSAVERYVVDTTPCSLTLDSPADGRVFTSTDDVDRNPANGLQIDAGVRTPDCSEFRVAVCENLAAVDFLAATASTSMRVTLGSAGPQPLCAQGRDPAGNLTEVRILVGAAPAGAPQLAIVSPDAGARVSRDGQPFGGVDHLADTLRATASCELDVTVDCSGIGGTIALEVDGAAGPTAACAANIASSLGGRAVLRNVSLPSARIDHTLIARETMSGLSGSSTPLAVSGDCSPPTVTIIGPTCGGFVGPDDDVSSAAGLQVPVRVASPNVPQADVTLTVVSGAGTSSTSTSLASALPPGATEHVFSAVDLGGAGSARLVASAIDAFGNTGVTATCAVTVTGLPTIDLDPLAKTSFTYADLATSDCVPGGGLDLVVAGSTNATSGSRVTVTIGSGAPIVATVSAGRFTACVPAPEGTSEIRATVDDTVFSDGVAGTAAAVPILIDVETATPVGVIAPVRVTILDRRAGTVRFDFTTVASASGARLSSYVVRCAPDEILSESAFAAATDRSPTGVTPALPGSPDSLQATGFLTGTTSHCTVRGRDAAGNLTPLPGAGNDAIVAPAFRIATFDGVVTDGAMGVAGARAAGDVNGDGFKDFIVTGSGSAYLFLGQSGGRPPVLGTRFLKSIDDPYFGSVARGVGDFDGDGLDDLVIADPGASALLFDGEVYVFYGRATWPASITVSESSCVANFCVRAPGSIGSLGWDVAGLGDFDGRPGADVAVASPTSNEVFILSGRSGIPNGTTFVLGTNDPVGFRLIAPVTDGSFGWTLGAPGNVVGTGLADLVIGQTGQWPPGNNVPSRLYRVNGRNLPGGASGLTTLASNQAVRIAADGTLSNNFGTWDLQGIAFGDLDADGGNDLFAFSLRTGTVDVGAWVLYGSGAADYPLSTGLRVNTTVSGLATAGFGLGRGFATDPNFGHVGDVNRDGASELFAGGITASSDGNHSVALYYGGRPRRSGSLDLQTARDRTAILQPALEPHGNTSPYPYWLVGFPGDVVGDTATSYPDLVVCDGGTFDPGYPQGPGRIFVLY